MEYSLRTVSLRKELWLFDFWCMPFCGILTYHPTENIQTLSIYVNTKSRKNLVNMRKSALADLLNGLTTKSFAHSRR